MEQKITGHWQTLTTYQNVESLELNKGLTLSWMQKHHCRKQAGRGKALFGRITQGNMPKVVRYDLEEIRRVQTGIQTFLFLLKSNIIKKN